MSYNYINHTTDDEATEPCETCDATGSVCPDNDEHFQCDDCDGMGWFVVLNTAR